MEYVYRTQGTCSTNIELNVEDAVADRRPVPISCAMHCMKWDINGSLPL